MNSNFEGLAFSEILESLMNYPGDCRIISDKLNKQGYKISARSLQQYRSSSCLPSLQTAKIILASLGENIPNNILNNSLILEKEKQEELNLDSSKIDKHIVLYEKEFKQIAGGEPGFVSDVINDRINELYPNQKKKFSLYVKDLIEADILKNVINK